MPAGRPGRLDDPEFAKQVADLFVSGMAREEMAQELDCAKDTIRVWVRDPRVQAHARRLSVERVQRISRKIDSEIEARLAGIDDWALDEILKVRKEYLDRPLKISDGEMMDTGKTTNELAEAMDQSPDFAEQLLALVESNKKSKKG